MSKHLEDSAPKEKAPQTREALLEAAEMLFTRKGYAAVSTREVAEAAGVNLGAIQYYFGSKAKLFVEAVNGMLGKRSCAPSDLPDPGKIRSPEEAAVCLGRFIVASLEYMLRPTGPHACRLIFREILSDTGDDPELFETLISTFAENFSQPFENQVVAIIRHLRPATPEQQLHQCARSILGQCSFYVSHRPFLERLEGADFSKSPLFEQTAKHVTEFSLRGLGCGEELVESAMRGLER